MTRTTNYAADLPREARVNLALNAQWRPVHDGHPTAVPGRRASFPCFRSCYAVEAPMGTLFRGNFQTFEDAARFGFGWRAVREVEPYWYAPAFGVVETIESALP